MLLCRLIDKVGLTHLRRWLGPRRGRNGVAQLGKRYGQHFLRDPQVIDSILAAANVTADDNVLEIGPGRGAITLPMAWKARHLLAYEIDAPLAEQLQTELGQRTNIEILHEDFLQADVYSRMQALGGNFKVVANLPYYVTTPILEKLFHLGRSCIREMWLMMQHEVAQRIVSLAIRESGSLSYFANFYTQPGYLFRVPPQAFAPPPEVESAVVHFSLRDELPSPRPKRFFAIVRRAFASRRQMLRRSLSPWFQVSDIEAAGIDPARRPETLTMQEFVRLEEVSHERNLQWT